MFVINISHYTENILKWVLLFYMHENNKQLYPNNILIFLFSSSTQDQLSGISLIGNM